MKPTTTILLCIEYWNFGYSTLFKAYLFYLNPYSKIFYLESLQIRFIKNFNK